MLLIYSKDVWIEIELFLLPLTTRRFGRLSSLAPATRCVCLKKVQAPGSKMLPVTKAFGITVFFTFCRTWAGGGPRLLEACGGMVAEVQAKGASPVRWGAQVC